jgi:hypothetical protein
LFAGAYRDTPKGSVQFVATTAVTLYLFHENSGKKRHGGFPEQLKKSSEWVQVGGTQMQWDTGHGQHYWMKVWSRKVDPGVNVDVEIHEEWVGGIAAKYDDGSWRQYEEQEQQLGNESGQVAEGGDVCAPAEASQEADEEVRDADRRAEEAEMEQVIALSIKAEEERMRQVAAQAAAAQPEEDPAAVAAAASSAAAAEAEVAAAHSAAASAVAAAEAEVMYAQVAAISAGLPLPPLPAPQPETEAAPPVVVHDEILPASTPNAPDPSTPAVPRMLKLQPLAIAPAALPSLVGAASAAAVAESAATLDRMRADALLTRERDAAAARVRATAAAPASHVVAAAAAPPPPPCAPAAAQPTNEERLQRQEHLRRQRDLLVAKRTAERHGQLEAYKQASGRPSAAVDSAISSFPAADGAGTGAPTPADQLAANPGGADAAQRMRQALTLQLRQSLM